MNISLKDAKQMLGVQTKTIQRWDKERKMIKTFSLKHNLNLYVKVFLYAYLAVLNAIIKDIWVTITWKEWQIPGKKQKRLYPIYRKDNAFKRELRAKYQKDWDYAAHWIDSALKTAFSIISSS